MHIPKPLFLGTLFAMQLLSSTHAAVELAAQTSTIGHAFLNPNIVPPENLPGSVVNYLIDQDQSSGGGGALPAVSVNWDTNAQFTLTVSAPPGQKFSVQVPAGRAVGFGGFLWWESTRGGFSVPGSVAVSFSGLEGTPPAFSGSDSVLSDSHGFFGFADLEGTLVTNDFAFTALRLTATVAPQFTGNGTEDYVPHAESSLQLFYQTPETTDPGRFVFIVPAGTNAPPTNHVPVVNWIRPTNGAAFAVGTDILLTAGASDPDGTVSFVDFRAGTNLIGRVSGPSTNGVHNLIWSNAPAGTFALRAEAVDNLGARSTLASVQIFVHGTNAPPTNNVLPVVNWIRPTNGALLAPGTPILLTASATDADGAISFVDFFAGSLNLGRANGPSTNGLYDWVWTNASPGMFQLRAEAVDDRGARGVSASAQVAISGVTNAPPTNYVPVVNWIRPTNGAAFAVGTDILLTAGASDPDGTVSFVDFRAGTNLIGRVSGPLTNGVHNLVWSNAPAGTFALRAEAVDNLGARSTFASVLIFVHGTNAPPTNNVLPVVNWIRPTNGASFAVGAPIVLTASATDTDGTISFVDFFAGSVYLARGTKTPTNSFYNLTWTNPPAGIFQLRADATDNAGGRGSSVPVQVVVSDGTNALPVVNWIRPTNGAILAPGTPILLTASATDADGAISFVDFFAGSVYLARGIKTPTNSFYNLTWTNPPAGIFQLRADATDNAGGRGSSASVQVVVGGADAVDLGVVEASTIGHGFLNPNLPGLPPILPNAVTDLLVDQDQNSGGGGLLRAVSVNWDTNTQFKLTVSAPQGMKFVVDVPAERLVKFGGFLWWESTRGGFSAPGQVTANFTDLEGTAPEFSQSDSVLSDSHGFFGFADLEGTGVTNSFAFTSITLTCTVAPQYTGHGTEYYSPHLESSMQLYYSTTETNDPGSFVSIVPAGALPMLRMISTSPETGVDLMIYGRVGLTHIVECSPDTVSWTTIGTAVMPPAAKMPIRDAGAVTTSSRFYRVIELP